MVPTGDFRRLKYDVLERYKDIDIPITFGVLIADYRQTLAREYILNYVNIFDKKSNKYIDFFIPGYAQFCDGDRTCLMDKNQDHYYFSQSLFDDFIIQFEQVFEISYEYNPMLVLIELNGTNFAKSKKIVLSLDDLGGGVKKSGVLFHRIFEIAKNHVSLESFSGHLISTYVTGNFIDSVISSLGVDIIKEVYTQQKNIRKFTIK